MSPLRILVLSLLFYFLYRLLFGATRKPVADHRQPSGNEAALRDVLVEDPVCHVYVPQGQAVSYQKDGQTHYFCSDKCCKIFLADQETAK